MDNKDIYYTRVLPIVKYEEIVENGRTKTICKDNVTHEEMKSLSMDCARMVWHDGDELYIAEMPLAYNEGASVKFSLVYLFDEMSDDEQEKYFDRTIILPLTKKDTVKVYGERSKQLFPKKRTRTKEEK